jgi:hypothetical protein
MPQPFPMGFKGRQSLPMPVGAIFAGLSQSPGQYITCLQIIKKTHNNYT